MTKEELEGLIAERVLRDVGSPLWPDGPSLKKLLNCFVDANIKAADLDAWLPLGSPKTQRVIAFFFQGAALRLADKFVVHRRVGMMSLVFAGMTLFLGKNPVETTKLFLGLGMPSLTGNAADEVVHMLGADAIDEWIKSGLNEAPPTAKFVSFKKLVEQNLAERLLESMRDCSDQEEVVVARVLACW